MSDIDPTATPVTDPAPVADPVTDPAPEVEADLFDDAAVDQFPRSYVEKLRREAAEHRTAAAPYKETFGSLDEDVRDYLIDLNRTLINDPVAALDEMEALADRIRAANPQAAKKLDAAVEKGKAEAAEEIDPDAPLTLAQWEKIQAQRQAKADAEASVAAIHEEAKSLSTEWANYDKDADDHGDLAQLLFVASHQTKGDLKAAHAKLEARFNANVEKAVEARLAEIRSGAAKWPSQTSQGAPPAEEKNTPKTLADADKSAKARLDRWFAERS